MAFLLLIILVLVTFVYFSGLNPQDLTVWYLPDQSVTASVALVVMGCILIGFILGYLVHLYSILSHLVKHWKRDRAEKRAREVSAIYREGVLRLLSGDLKRAHALLQRALDRDPSRVETYIAMANVRIQEGEPQEAVSLLLRAKSVDPRSPEVQFKLASTYEETGRDDEAARTYQEILALEGDNRKALRGLRDLHVRYGRWREALDLQKKLIKVAAGSRRQEEENQKLLYLRYEVARLDLEQGAVEQAAAEFRDIIRQAPEFTPSRVSLGDACRAQNRPEEAVAVWQEGYAALGKSIFLSRLEDHYIEGEDPAALLAFYRSTLMEKRDDLMLHLFFGKLCLRLEMVDEALEQLYYVESAGADFPQLHYLLAEVHRRRNRIEESIREYRKALGTRNTLRLSYLCDSCGAESAEWESRCPDCGTWGTFSVVGRQVLKNTRPLEIREIHHGERDQWTET
jgi:lipopolysaccharide biosynthesis regulator YciM